MDGSHLDSCGDVHAPIVPPLVRTPSDIIVKSRSANTIGDDEESGSSPVILQRTSSRSHLKEDCFIKAEDEESETTAIEDDEGSRDLLLLNIKTEAPTVQKKGDKLGVFLKAQRVFSANRSMIRIEVKRTYTVWMIKCIIFDQMGTHFDPPNVTLFGPDRLELRNDSTLSSYGIPNGCTLFAIPSESKAGFEKKSSVADIFNFKAGAGKIHVPNTFAIGRGLAFAIVGTHTSFTIYPVSKSERFITGHTDFQIIFEKLDVNSRTRRRLNNASYNLQIERGNGPTTVSYTPIEDGLHLVTVLYKKQHICLSPYQLTVKKIDPHSSDSAQSVRQLVFVGWDVEAAQVLANLSDDIAYHDKIFEVGIKSVVLHLLQSHDPDIQCHMIRVFANLINREENKVRIMIEGGQDIIVRVVNNPFWHSNSEVSRFIGRMCAFSLESNPEFAGKFLENVGIAPIFTLADVNDPICVRYAAKCLLFLSESEEHRSSLLDNPLLLEALIAMLQINDHTAQRHVLATLSNICKSEGFSKSINSRKLLPILKATKSTNPNIAIDALYLLGRINHRVIVETFISENGYEPVYSTFHLDEGMQWWEASLFSKTEDYFQRHFNVREHQFQSDMNWCCLHYVGNVLSLSNRDELAGIAKHMVTDYPQVVCALCKFSVVLEERIQKEAISTLHFLCTVDDFRQHLITSPGFVWLLSALRPLITTESLLPPLQIIAQCSISFSKGFRLMGDDTSIIMALFRLLYHPEKSYQRQATVILGNLLKTDRYRNGLVTNSPEVFFPMVYEAVQDGEVFVHDKIPLEEIEIISELAPGAGNTKVYEVNYKGQRFALKKFDPQDLAFNIKEFRTELLISTLIRHKRMVSSIGGAASGQHMYFVTKLFSKGSLAAIIYNKDLDFSISRIVGCCLDIAKGLLFLHSKGIIHRDIKPGNLLLDDKWRVSITDFGTTRWIDRKRMTPTVGTVTYMAPEIIDQTQYTCSADIYSFAIVMWEMLERKSPYPESMGAAIEIVQACKQGYRPHFSNTNSSPTVQRLQSLISRCWVTDPGARPSCEEILKDLQEMGKIQSVEVIKKSGDSSLQAESTPIKSPKLSSKPAIVSDVWINGVNPQPTDSSELRTLLTDSVVSTRKEKSKKAEVTSSYPSVSGTSAITSITLPSITTTPPYSAISPHQVTTPSSPSSDAKRRRKEVGDLSPHLLSSSTPVPLSPSSSSSHSHNSSSAPLEIAATASSSTEKRKKHKRDRDRDDKEKSSKRREKEKEKEKDKDKDKKRSKRSEKSEKEPDSKKKRKRSKSKEEKKASELSKSVESPSTVSTSSSTELPTITTSKSSSSSVLIAIDSSSLSPFMETTTPSSSAVDIPNSKGQSLDPGLKNSSPLTKEGSPLSQREDAHLSSATSISDTSDTDDDCSQWESLKRSEDLVSTGDEPFPDDLLPSLDSMHIPVASDKCEESLPSSFSSLPDLVVEKGDAMAYVPVADHENSPTPAEDEVKLHDINDGHGGDHGQLEMEQDTLSEQSLDPCSSTLGIPTVLASELLTPMEEPISTTPKSSSSSVPIADGMDLPSLLATGEEIAGSSPVVDMGLDQSLPTPVALPEPQVAHHHDSEITNLEYSGLAQEPVTEEVNLSLLVTDDISSSSSSPSSSLLTVTSQQDHLSSLSFSSSDSDSCSIESSTGPMTEEEPSEKPIVLSSAPAPPKTISPSMPFVPKASGSIMLREPKPVRVKPLPNINKTSKIPKRGSTLDMSAVPPKIDPKISLDQVPLDKRNSVRMLAKKFEQIG